MGAFFALVFYTLEAVRVAERIRGLRLWINDILIFTVAGFVTFCFLLVRCNGEIRGFVLVGELSGLLIFKALFSKLYLKLMIRLISRITGILKSISAFFGRRFLKTYVFLRKILKKLTFSGKKGLKNQDELVYTEKNSI